MQTEIEAKWLNIDHDEFREVLKRAGAKLEHSERLMRRRNFHHPEANAKNGWIRVRDEGDIITLSYKEMASRSLHGMSEVNIVVDNFDQACRLITAIDFSSASYQETKRESWKLGEVEIELDTWPWIPSFIEIEAPSEELFKATFEKLSLNIKDAHYGDVAIVYQSIYDIPDADEIYAWPEIAFTPVPDWLEKRRIQDKAA
jgi:adenylate cyclase class 2